jgi:agmatinase
MKEKERRNVREVKLREFDANSAAIDEGIFGLPFRESEAECVVIPVAWEATVSYRGGTSKAPPAILEASKQVDLWDEDYPYAWKNGIALVEGQVVSPENAQRAKKLVENFRESEDPIVLTEVNELCGIMVEDVRSHCQRILRNGQLPFLLGGDHSTALGIIQAQADEGPVGILQIDAHMDLREAYEGFKYSHASVMYNALSHQNVKSLVQVGIRDYCEEENDRAIDNSERIAVFTDRSLAMQKQNGRSWKDICDEIVSSLPERVHLSVDVDGLEPSLCPNTGTPVPGGLQWNKFFQLVSTVGNSGRKLVSIDLVETGYHPHSDWDANVSSRILFRLSSIALNQRVESETSSL